jgi:hypothetical protein
MRKLLSILVLIVCVCTNAQDAINYQLPPKTMMDIALAKPTPTISVDNKGEWMLVIERNPYPTVEELVPNCEELGQPEVRVAGMRINPNNFSPSRQNYSNNFILKNISTGKEYKISGLPASLLATTAVWNEKQDKIAITNVTATQVDLYVIDVSTQKAMKVNKAPLNIVMGVHLFGLMTIHCSTKQLFSLHRQCPKSPLRPKAPLYRRITEALHHAPLSRI